MDTSIKLFSSFQLGASSRLQPMVMAPLTRMWAAAGNLPQWINPEYYSQRASPALMIRETLCHPYHHPYHYLYHIVSWDS